ncbi:MAG: EamA/RhaT family transporter [Firmicutes bacterium HGW-Firmicutes-15]|nr:MAG: EamA/RhaT family transporter [Firmicutes bacterium HGW-Firmicutes-15]
MSTSSIMIRLCTAPAVIIAFYRLFFTAAISILPQTGSLHRGLQILSRKDIMLILGSGFFLALHFAFWINSLHYTSVSSSVLFTNMQVIFVIIFSLLFLKEKLTTRLIYGIVTALFGSIIIASGDLQYGKILGDMLALASGLFVAIYFTIGKDVRSRVNITTYTFLVSIAACLVLLLFIALSDLRLFAYPMNDWLLFILMALVPGIGGHLVLNWILKYVKAPVVSVSILGESVGASILAYFFFNEALLWYQVIGGLFILSGIYCAVSSES